ncbi:hypothetical protein K437DRAFT_52724 [Tilletiaria anomala UBC 951]|uniref:Alpha/beta-hydrolase n=1 Tax=Tilletiaria anomala (strain ATCC 24038 / CBS 436.72 / UBC 951) TaxID=1037660 RepID=A0A066VDG0_TILAU|nr:uncharacterized protein K437DRAFT_52724 [Tilletiaria anomala UBC 951]KDN36635.1 hypothetical protein K437DRAFT_52724 [Tilletiaria anomala UBC 951]
MVGDQPHHHNMSTLWATKLELAAQVGAYPYQGGKFADLEPVFQFLISSYPNETCGTIADDDWAAPFIDPGNALVQQAKDAKTSGNNATSYEYFLRAQALFRISHFPWIGPGSTSKLKLQTFNSSKDALKSAMDVAHNITFEEVSLAYNNSLKLYPDARDDFVVWAFRPATTDKNGKKTARAGPLPTILLIAGLGLNKPDQMASIAPLLRFGYAVVVMDMPGTGDAPITGRYTYAGAAGEGTPPSDTNLWSAVVEYLQSQPHLYDAKKLFVLGLSTAAYWTFKLMYLMGEHFIAGVGQGGPVHYTFQEDWLNASQTLSYPCNLPVALGHAFGYDDPVEFTREAWHYSLLNQGLIGTLQPGQILSVNGFDDLVFPVDDSILLATAYPPIVANATSPISSAAPAPMLRLFPGADNTGEGWGFPYVEQFFEQAIHGFGSGFSTSLTTRGTNSLTATSGARNAGAHDHTLSPAVILTVVLYSLARIMVL